VTVLAVLAPVALAVLLGFCLTPIARRISVRVGAIDEPDPRKVHQEPMPRLGGLAVLAASGSVLLAGHLGFFGPYLHLGDTLWRGITMGLIPIAAISFLDDVRGVRARWKALAHFAGALLAVSSGVVLNPEIHFLGAPLQIGLLAAPLSVLWIVGVTNAFNLVDGLDGLSAGLALISAVSLGAVFLVAGERVTAACVFVLAGALLGFLPFNAYPAKIFLGDTGAASVGFILACFALKGGSTLSAGFATVLPLLVLGLPVAETLISMTRRLMRRAQRGGSGVFEADRDHIHHRLLSFGLGHKQAVLILYGVGLLLAVLGFVSLFLNSRQAGILLAALFLAAFIGVKRLGYDEFALLRRGVVLKVYDAPVVRSALFAVFFDLGLVGLSYYVARGLKRDVWALNVPSAWGLTLVALLSFATIVALWAFGLYRGTWRLASLDDVVRCGAAILVASAFVWVVSPKFLEERAGVSQLVVFALVAAAFVCGSRVSYRLLQDQVWKASAEGQRVLIYGAGNAGMAAFRELQRNPQWGMKPVGFLDDDPRLKGKTVSGVPVVGGFESLETSLERSGALGIAISTAKIPAERVQLIRQLAQRSSVAVYRFEIRFDSDAEAKPGGVVPAENRP
jgi:UDP-GlcNAc:undecaprenyl-phosphate/decaprenyl-phosphate GlcNAc-1-phosphate transferase